MTFLQNSHEPVEFVRARIAGERETARNEQAQRARLLARFPRAGNSPTHDELCEEDTAGAGLTTSCGCQARRAQKDPAAILARCDFFSWLLNQHKPTQIHLTDMGGGSDTYTVCQLDGEDWETGCATVARLAALWFSHPDYRLEWAL